MALPVHHLPQRGRPRRGRPPRGATTVELAVTLPILFLLFFTALEFGRMQTVRHSVHNAAYEGARRGVIPGASDRQIRLSAGAVLDSVKARKGDIAIDQDEDFITVTVSVPFKDQAWFAPLYFRNVDLRSTVTLSKDKV